MTSKERVMTVLRHEEPDRVPVGEVYIDYPIVEKVLGRETFCWAHARTMKALWGGFRDEVVESQKKDTVEFTQKVGVDVVTVYLVPPKNQIILPPKQLDERTWEDSAGNILKYYEETEDIVLVKRGNKTVTTPAQPPPDGSEWELWDYVVEKLGKTHFIIASYGGPALGIAGYYTSAEDRFTGFEKRLIEIFENPEHRAEAEVRSALGYRETVKMLSQRGLNAIRMSPDYGYQRPYFSPEVFRRAFLPGLKACCDEMHAGGLPLLLHCDSNMDVLIDQMVEAKVDIYQAIQKYEPIARYKQLYGDKLTLWGAVDCHDLATASREEIRKHVRYLIKQCAKGGGFILGSSHNIMISTKYDNFMTILETAFNDGKYPIRI
ncbi:hypothetical protein H8D98_00865 [bacterium]|nr:hypothetical protein [bacterium]